MGSLQPRVATQRRKPVRGRMRRRDLIRSSAEENAMMAALGVVVAMAASVVGGADPKPPVFEFADSQRPGDSGRVEVSGGKAVVVITSSTGIGGITVAATRGAWPRDVTVVVKGGRKSLEGFTLTTDRLFARGSAQDTGRVPFYLKDAGGKIDIPDPAKAGDRAGELNVAVGEREEGMGLVLPANLLAGSKRLRVTWVDAFRR